jgi:hypothetical protein
MGRRGGTRALAHQRPGSLYEPGALLTGCPRARPVSIDRAHITDVRTERRRGVSALVRPTIKESRRSRAKGRARRPLGRFSPGAHRVTVSRSSGRLEPILSKALLTG